MPIEIKELVIRTLVGASAGVASGADESAMGLSARDRQTASTEEIVQECVRQVLNVLKKDRER